jgi:hypothetical protein
MNVERDYLGRGREQLEGERGAREYNWKGMIKVHYIHVGRWHNKINYFL